MGQVNNALNFCPDHHIVCTGTNRKSGWEARWKKGAGGGYRPRYASPVRWVDVEIGSNGSTKGC
ncbi:MAG: hypothetical protein ACLRS8_05895 [Parabacteroides merdae]